MSPTFHFVRTPHKKADTVVVLVSQDGKPGEAARSLNTATRGFFNAALENAPGFQAKRGQTFLLPLPEKTGYARALVVGLGNVASLTTAAWEEIGAKTAQGLRAAGSRYAALFIESPKLPGRQPRKKSGETEPLSTMEIAARMAFGVRLASYRFERYKTEAPKEPKTPELTDIDLVTSSLGKTEHAFDAINAVAEGVIWARDLVNEPPNILYPGSFAQRIQDELAPLGVSVELFDAGRMQQMGMGALLAVGQGSARPPYMVVMRWTGLPKASAAMAKPLAFVGKGVTFDTGGISIKPSSGMEEMKFDMGGAAAVVGLMKTLAMRKARVNVVGAVGLVENMPSGHAYRPADVLTSHSGKTIEVLNTDAEGRLVLCDVLSYVQQAHKPRLIIDLATLTGAMLVALGQEYCGTFANDDALWTTLEAASKNSGEKLWRMPLDDVWSKEMDSQIADLRNLASWNRNAGSCTAAAFLGRFIEEGTPWAHLDIAGTAWISTGKPLTPKGATGFGVRLLNRLVMDYEKA